MGCDIHLNVEVLDAEGKWQYAESVVDNVGRNYRLFAMLAGVRNEFDIVPLAEPRWEVRNERVMIEPATNMANDLPYPYEADYPIYIDAFQDALRQLEANIKQDAHSETPR